MSSEPRDVVFYPNFQVPLQFRQCAACFKTEYETWIPMRTCSRCRVTHYCNNTCQKNDFPSHKEPCLKRRDAIRRKDRDSLDLKWRPSSRAGGEGAALVPYNDLQKAFMSWTQKNLRILAWTHYQASDMRRSTWEGGRKCLFVKLTGHRDTSDDIRFEVANIDTILGIDILRKWGAFDGPFAQVRAKQATIIDGVYVFALLLECGPIIHFMPIGAPEELLQTWVDNPEWKAEFLRDVKT